MSNVWIGTSGWVYKQWAGNFYPKDWPKKNEFGFYVTQFPTVEINATFYRLPTVKTVRAWHDKAPEGFVFAVKGSRYLTHIKRLKDTSRGLQKYFRRLVPLADRTGPILWQLPPTFPKTDDTLKRLDRFLSRLPKQYRHAVKFRHPSWMNEATFNVLRRHGAANVWLSSLRMPADYTITADFVYLRFHGLKDGAYHDYTAAELAPWARELAKAARRGVPAYAYFNNDLNTRAPLNAQALMEKLGKLAVQPRPAAPEPAKHATPRIPSGMRIEGIEISASPRATRRPAPSRRRTPRVAAPARARTQRGTPTYARAMAPAAAAPAAAAPARTSPKRARPPFASARPPAH
jgi:uncharacterized protein YecE (DUF72 family)